MTVLSSANLVVVLFNVVSSLRMVLSGKLRRVDLVRTDVSEEPSASFIRVTRIGELRKTLAVTCNRRTLRRNTEFSHSCYHDDGGAKFLLNVGSYKSHTA
jgi:hypothetical protein